MFLLERNAMITISSGFKPNPAGPTRFRWNMHVSLPFPFPGRKCASEDVRLGNNSYKFGVHNHFERVFLTPKDQCAIPHVMLRDRNKPTHKNSSEFHVSVEHLQSVAIFELENEFPNSNEAFSGADGKIKECFNYLSAFLSRCQKSAPYLAAWLVYPISFLDVGTIYHSVLAFSNTHNRWEHFASAPAISMARRLQHPLFFIENIEPSEEASIMDAVDEMLAEAQLSLYRGLPRLTILNSYGAVESLANAVFRLTKINALLENNVPRDVAEQLVEDERQRNRTDSSFLFHRGMQSACGRSLQVEDKQKYDDLLELQRKRHQVAHVGYRPTDDEARDGHKLACEVAQWLAGIAGMRVKPLLPSEDSVVSGISTIAHDSFAISAAERQFLAFAMGLSRSEASERK